MLLKNLQNLTFFGFLLEIHANFIKDLYRKFIKIDENHIKNEDMQNSNSDPERASKNTPNGFYSKQFQAKVFFLA